MRVLVAYASKHGSTAEIAQSIADGIRHGLTVTTAPPVADLEFIVPTVNVWSVEDAPEPGDFDAVVIGSAVYMGRWLHSARSYLKEHANALACLPLWLFSSGPIGTMGLSDAEPADFVELRQDLAVEDHIVFGGRLDRHSLHLAEKAVLVALRTPDGDFRDWAAIAQWSRGIAASLNAGVRA
ncbi:MAG: Flavodoxin-like protein [Pseudonocardiales bacterium]|nr:Flavodoxin-like protein [Pseudonocardiales bacterium]